MRPARPLLLLSLALPLSLAAGAAWAQAAAAGPDGSFAAGAGQLLNGLSQSLGGTQADPASTASLSGRILQLVALMTVLSIAPGLLVVMTSFTRFVIVFSMLRSALGLNQTPPNMVLSAMALFMTFFVMQPVFNDSWTRGVQPLMQNRITEEQAFPLIGAPFKAFMFVNTRPKDIALFEDLTRPQPAGSAEAQPAPPPPATPDQASWRVLVPAFMISELRRAFTIGFLIYLPFIAIDLIVASVLMSAGMMMLPPVMISLPFKVIFFVLIDGWYMLAGSLMHSYLAYSGGG
ncbi:flagellar type III secretion system pore protein FliP [Acidimangrovimonas sediminis]|uniref:flagellar type III secretion system pore protein FliP n=1 Tax=Acidimangrovimonas sediminis TaxID=2056283 RepID=UPI001E3BE321|nr:flagellar type III secretion system pore protein FliP [Acidimangrovimonas sediminis]